MKVYKNFEELAIGINKKGYEIEESWNKWIDSDCMYIDNIKIIKQIYENEMNFIIIDINDNDCCKKYLMKYKIKDYNWKVYVDDIEGWQDCKVVDIQNAGNTINRATVICKSGTKLNRVVEYALDDEDMHPNRNIYYIEK